jgi:hypothetical protein
MIRLPVNIDELSFLLHRGHMLPFIAYLNPTSGDIITLPSDATALAHMLHLHINQDNINMETFLLSIFPNLKTMLFIPDLYADSIYSLMSEFISRVEKSFPRETKALTQLLNRQEGFHGFHLLLVEMELVDQFLDFRNTFYRVKAQTWLEAHDIIGIESSHEKMTNCNFYY